MSTLGTFAEYADFGLLETIDQARQRNEPGYADRVVAQAEAKRKASRDARTASRNASLEAQGKSRYIGRKARIQPVSAISRPSAEAKAIMPSMKVTKQSEKSKKAVANSLAEIAKKKGLKMRNLAIGGGLGLAGLGTLGAIAYNNRNSGRRSEMSFGSAFANFAEAIAAKDAPKPRGKKFVAGGKVYQNESDIPTPLRRSVAGNKGDLTADELAGIKGRSKKGDKVMSAEDIKSTQERLKKYGGQRAVERNIDKGGDVYKGAKGMDYVTRTGALLGSPERNMIAAGKNSKNGFIKGASEVAEKVGRAGYKTGAIGARGVLNKVVGRTATGKVARLGAAGIGLSAIGGAMKRNRQERG